MTIAALLKLQGQKFSYADTSATMQCVDRLHTVVLAPSGHEEVAGTVRDVRRGRPVKRVGVIHVEDGP